MIVAGRGVETSQTSASSTPDAGDPPMVTFKCFSHLADRTIKDGSGFTRSPRSIWSTEFSSEEIEVRQTGLRETIIRASNPATMMERVLAGALVLVPSADGAVIGLCTDVASVVFAAASGKLADSVGSVLSIESSLSGVAIKSGVTQRCQYAPSDQRVDVVLAAKIGIVSLICVPLSRGTDRVGVLILASSKASAFDAADESSLASLAHFVSSVIDAAMELDLCITELVGSHPVATEDLGQGRLGGSKRNGRDRSTFVANVVCPEAALDSATRDRIERTLTEMASRSFSNPSSHLRPDSLLVAKHCHDSRSARRANRTAGSPKRPQSVLVVPLNSLRSSARCLSCPTCPNRSAWE